MPCRDVENCVQRQADQHGFALDASQRAAVAALQRMAQQLSRSSSPARFPPARLLRRLRRPTPVRGVYLCGGVGRGKSFVMNAFFSCVPIEHKQRVHFHQFMQDVHARLTQLKGRVNPLAQVAKDISRQVRLLCLDEFHITDIADAMLIRGLLHGLFARGVAIVMTSNSEPAALYPNGLQREQFLPTIAMIKAHMDVVPFVSDVDYRLQIAGQMTENPALTNGLSELAFPEIFRTLAAEDGTQNTHLLVEDRAVMVRCHANGVAWFDFSELCEGARGKADYIELARRFHTILLSGVRPFDEDSLAQARRFMWLVDALYDRGVKLIFSAAVPLAQLGHDDLLDGAFQRVRSRLVEMLAHADVTRSVDREAS
ncbi:MAG TPA: cell division protein ZapE [Halothiobacillus sp.]|nr:cell division protein ZapE [Halothiobacillus sp.]